MKYVALLRGINVGGHGRLAMPDLQVLLHSLGYTDVSTYLQSGNAVFSSTSSDTGQLESAIERAIQQHLGLKITVLIRTGAELSSVVEANPFEHASAHPTQLHIAFLSDTPDSERLAEIDAPAFTPDDFRVGDRCIYLWLPRGMARTKLGNDLWERRLGLRATTRNWNTVTRLRTLTAG